MELFLGVVLGLIILVLLVVVHELGHAIVARRNGVVVEEFGIGFPPKAWGKKLRNGIEFSLNWLPIGGFVKLQGEYDSSRGKGDYGAASFWVKTKILLAGVMINWLVAALLLTGLALVGMPKVLPNQYSVPSDQTIINKGEVSITALLPDYPAEKAGFRQGDVITKFDGKTFETAEDLVALTHASRGETVTVEYVRGDETMRRTVTLLEREKGSVFGAGLGQMQLTRSTWSAPIVGIGTTVQFTGVTLSGIGDILANLAQGAIGKFSTNELTRRQADAKLSDVSNNVAGPVGILGVLFPSVREAGLTQIVFFTALISLTLAVMNVLPIPGLDGGRFYTMAIFRILKKPLTREREETIQMVGVLLIFVLIISVTISDVGKLL